MVIRHVITLLGTTLLLTASSAVAQTPISPAAAPQPSAATAPASPVPAPAAPTAPIAPLPPAVPQTAAEGSWLTTVPLWLAAASLVSGAFVAFIWLHLHQQERRRRRLELARQEARAFREREAVKNVLDILDYEEYRTFYVPHPEDGRLLTFEANDARLRRALRSHGEMVKTRHGLDEIKRLATQPDNGINPKTLAIFQQYESEEFVIEIILRDWFDSFLGGLEYFEILLESGLLAVEDIKPFIIYWIKLIGDRRYRRKGGSGFYDQLFHYIKWAGYSRVQNLFERFGYKILPPPYSSHDFAELTVERKYDTHRALCLAKAAYLVYEDREYVNDIVRKWVSSDIDNLWMKMSPREYVVDLIKGWMKEGEQPREFTLRENFRYLDMLITDTQAFMFRQGNDIVLVFRGSQQLNDWRTNFKIRLKQFTLLADQESVPPKGRVHRGFLDAWQSVEKMVIYYLRKWQTPDTRLWITGHSLGGALAAMATISLEAQGFKVSGLYTFGQPRIADWSLVNYMNRRMRDGQGPAHKGHRINRYANNNDVVPLIPPPILPWMPTRVYGHMGNFHYFDFRGNLQRQSFLGQRVVDRLLGFLFAIGRSGLDAVDDHKMEFYLANLQRALEKEEEEAKIEAEKEMIGGNYEEVRRERRALGKGLQ